MTQEVRDDKAQEEFRKPGRTAANLTPHLEKRLLAYLAVASAAGVGISAAAQPASAEIVYTPTHVVIGGAGEGRPAYFPIDLNNDGIVDFMLASFVGASTRLVAQSVEIYPCYCQDPNGVIDTNHPLPNEPKALVAGIKIGPARVFQPNNVAMIMAAKHINKNSTSQVLSTTFPGKWANGGKGVHDRYLGLKFLIDGEVHYGWARITISKTSALSGYAYETDVNKAIVTGDTGQNNNLSPIKPDSDSRQEIPASLGMLAAGANK